MVRDLIGETVYNGKSEKLNNFIMHISYNA